MPDWSRLAAWRDAGLDPSDFFDVPVEQDDEFDEPERDDGGDGGVLVGMALASHLIYDHGRSPALVWWLRESERLAEHRALHGYKSDEEF